MLVEVNRKKFVKLNIRRGEIGEGFGRNGIAGWGRKPDYYNGRYQISTNN